MTKADSAHGCANPTDNLPGNYDDSYTYDPTTGNLAGKSGVGAYTYTDANHAHAVTKIDGVEKYTYNANGNMETRTVGSDTFSMAYDAENRLVSVAKGGQAVAGYAYDGDGNRVLAKDYTAGQTNPDQTLYFGNYFEVFIDADYPPSGGQGQAPDCGSGRYYVYLPLVFGPPPLPGQVEKEI